ncbi:MAG: archaeosortase A, partial [Methanophagales archaeon]|nr:archaeosortase A [Methanophagales archaeon]
MLNLFNVGVYMVPPSTIYTSTESFHDLNKPIEIILACTAIQSMVLFIGLIFAVNAPMRRKLKAFFVSVPVIYGLNILRNVFVASAYFGQWFGSPLESFYIAHGVIARMGAMIALIVIAYAVFMILPEALDLVEDFFRFILKYPTKGIKKD